MNARHVPGAMMGRLANGNESDQGRRVHWVPLATAQYGHAQALCGAEPGRRSGGWDTEHFLGREVTCPRCVGKALRFPWQLNVGGRIRIKANAKLGTLAADATILEVNADHYIVHIDGDAPEWFGPVSFDGEVLQP